MRAKVFIVAALVAVASILGGSALGKSPPPPPPKPTPPKPAPAPPKPAPPAPKPAPPPPPPPVDPNQQLINRNGMPSFQDQHSTGTVTRIDPSQVPKGGTGDWPGSPTQRRFYTRNAVYPTCFTATGAYSGPSDWTGYAHLNGWMSWCSNGFWITYATGSAYGTVSGWYSISQQGAPYWSGGCIGGCQSISLKAYMNWHWAPPLTFSNNGTSWLTQTATPYGGYST